MQDRISAPYLEDDVSTARFHDVLCTAGAMGKTLLISPRAVDGGAAYYREMIVDIHLLKRKATGNEGHSIQDSIFHSQGNWNEGFRSRTLSLLAKNKEILQFPMIFIE